MKRPAKICELCGRAVDALTRHHLIPRARHSKNRTRRAFTREEARSRIALLCLPCHRHTHRMLSEKEMSDSYQSIELLRQHPDIGKFVAWIAGKPPGFLPRP